MTFLRSLLADGSYAFRALRRNPLFALSIVVTLSLAAGSATAVFSVVDAVILRPLAYDDAERLVQVHPEGRFSGGLDTARYRALTEEGSAVAEDWVAFQSLSRTRTDGEFAELLSVLAVTPGTTAELGIPLLHGRSFTEEDARPGASVAILGRAYFEQLGGDPGIVGETIRLESGPLTVVGVLEGEVRFPDYGGDRELWVPMQDDFTMLGRQPARLQGVWARLIDGVGLAEAQERADRLARSLQEANPRDGGWGVDLSPLGGNRANADTERALWFMAAIVGMILLVGVVNGSNLFGMRSIARRRELSIRSAIGGSRARILRQVTLEGLTLGLLGGLGAVALASLSLRAIEGLIPGDLLFFSPHTLGIEGRALLFAFVAAGLGGVLLGLIPGVTVLRKPGVLQARSATGIERGSRRAGSTLVVAQVALSMTLLVGAALFAGSFGRLVEVDPGFDAERLAQADFELSELRYPTAADRVEFLRRFETELEARSEVDGATVTGGTGLSFGELQAEGMPPFEEQPELIPTRDVRPDYFRVTGTELLVGRSFQPGDEGRDVAVIDVDLAGALWRSEDVVGRRFRIAPPRPSGSPGHADETWTEVVGVAGDLRLRGRDERNEAYQILYPRSPDDVRAYATLFVRTAGDPESVLPVIQEELRRLDPEQAIWRLRTGEDALGEFQEIQELLAVVMSMLGVIGVLLAGVGTFGVLGYSVRKRRREIGVRQALGARSATIRRLVLSDGLMLGGVGVAVGVAGALLLSGLAEGLLYGLSPRDPRVIAGSAVFLLFVVSVAADLPARNASAVDPADALRLE